MNTNVRKYNVSDAAMMEYAKGINVAIEKYLPSFTAFDSTIDVDLGQRLADKISHIQNIKSDNLVIDEQAEMTETLQNAMAACNTAYRTIVFFVRKAYSSKAKQNQFGLNDIEKARKNQANMISFMVSLSIIVSKHKDELVAAGCNPEVIDMLPTYTKKLDEANTRQDLFKKERGLITEDRIVQLNELYDMLLPFSQIAQIIYADSKPMLDIFVIPRPKSTVGATEDLILS